MDNRNSSTNLSPTHAVVAGRVSTQTIVLKDSSSPIKGLNDQNILAQKDIGVVEIGICTVQTAVDSIGNDFDNIGLVSLDGIFCPFIVHNTGQSHPLLPYWENPKTSGINSSSLNPFNPSNIFSASGVFNSETFFESGHNIALSNTFTSVGSGSDQDLSIYKELASKGYSENIVNRSVGLKAPLVLTGWGYDTNDNPVPSGNIEGQFHPDAFRNPSLWKSGPVDIRWDDNRKVWTAVGEPLQMISFIIVSSDPSTRSALVEIRQKTFNGVPYGSILEGEAVYVYDTDGCFLNEPNVDLTGRKGKAVLMYVDEEAAGLHFAGSYDPPEKYWNILSLCCPSIVCEE